MGRPWRLRCVALFIVFLGCHATIVQTDGMWGLWPNKEVFGKLLGKALEAQVCEVVVILGGHR